jgi:hypothetical protein
MLKFFSIASAAALLIWSAGACSSTDSGVHRRPGKPGAPVRLEAGTPVPLKPGRAGEVVVTLVPLAAVDRLRVGFRGEAGLSLQSAASQVFAAPVVGAPLTNRLSVIAEHEGRFHITVVVTTDAGGISSGRVISVPVVVGDPAKHEKMPVKAAPPVDAAGERIKSLPAVERVR